MSTRWTSTRVPISTSLGVLLYELLTGTTPITRETIRKCSGTSVSKLIREQEPPTPSSRLSNAGMIPEVAANRGMDSAKLSRLLRGDLDWIVMKCIEKDRKRRYDTADGLALDLQRHLANGVVTAPPARHGLPARKLIRRTSLPSWQARRWPHLSWWTIVSVWQAIRATHAEAEARRRPRLRGSRWPTRPAA